MGCLAAAWQPGRLKSESSSIALALAEVCAANPEAVLELDADGTLLEMTPTGGSTSARNSALLFQLQARARTSGDWIVGKPSARRSAMALRRKLAAYLANGARLGWLLLPLSRSVEVWTPEPAAGAHPPARVLVGVQQLEAGQEFPGLTLALAEIWAI